jgi:hypothetical protein
MEENIRVSAFGDDETVALRGIEPLHPPRDLNEVLLGDCG